MCSDAHLKYLSEQDLKKNKQEKKRLTKIKPKEKKLLQLKREKNHVKLKMK